MMWDTEDNKIRVNLSISLYGKEQSFNGVYEDGACWHEVLNDIVATLEASYGYSFDIAEEIGVYYKGKGDES